MRTAEIELIKSIDPPPTLSLLPTLNATATGPGQGESCIEVAADLGCLSHEGLYSF